MICRKDLELLFDYLAASDAYFELVDSLACEQPEEYPFLNKRKQIEDAREACIRAREVMERHRKEHGCRE